MGDGNGVEVLYGETRVGEGAMNNGEDGLEVGAGGDFGDDTAIILKNVNLRGDDVAQDGLAVFDDGGAGVVAGGFDAEDFHRSIIADFSGFLNGWENGLEILREVW